uniref:Farnesyl diphosphate synthase n=1 Tax=Hanusia phi TaxID=3032 RepID=A0A7S0I3W0_9CRYP
MLPKELPEESVAYIKKMCHYTCYGGKMTRGITVGSTYMDVAKSRGEEASDKALFVSKVIGWCIEWLQACFLVLDDIMDESQTRRGQPCWYKLPEVKKMAINDGLILESCIFLLLKKHVKPYSVDLYHNCVELFREVSFQTELGQLLDMTTESPEGRLDFSRFTIERYKLIVKYKTAFYSFYLPVAAGLYLAGLTGEKDLDLTKEITIAMGEYFQIQDDFLDCYGDPETIGKIGTDIQDKKCSWLCVQALMKCNEEQRKIMDENYGQHDDAKVAKIKNLYNELDLKNAFEVYEEESHQEIKKMIERVDGIPKSVFASLLAKIYKRSK